MRSPWENLLERVLFGRWSLVWLTVRTGTGTVPPLVSPLAAFLICNALGLLGLPLENIRQPNAVRLRTKRYIHAQDLFSGLPIAYPYGLGPSALLVVTRYMQCGGLDNSFATVGFVIWVYAYGDRSNAPFGGDVTYSLNLEVATAQAASFFLPCHDQPPTLGSNGLSVDSIIDHLDHLSGSRSRRGVTLSTHVT